MTSFKMMVSLLTGQDTRHCEFGTHLTSPKEYFMIPSATKPPLP